jgi:hydrogenase-4 membrane subunit HyfE
MRPVWSLAITLFGFVLIVVTIVLFIVYKKSDVSLKLGLGLTGVLLGLALMFLGFYLNRRENRLVRYI